MSVYGGKEELTLFGSVRFFLRINPMINVFNVLSFHIVFLFSEVRLKFFELRETFILPLGHGIESLGVLLPDVLGLIFYAGGKV